MSIVIGVLGVGKDDISIMNSEFAVIVGPAGIRNPILLFTEFAVKGLDALPTFNWPSISRSLKLLNPSGKVMKKLCPAATGIEQLILTVK